MATSLQGLKKGETILAYVSEVLPDHWLIMNYEGQLVRVLNQSGHNYKVNDPIKLMVKNTSPVEFQIFYRAARSIDRFA
jgi:hypothetical protein